MWRAPWTTFQAWKLPHAKWFDGARLNVTESCLNRHLETDVRTKTAILWEGERNEGAEASVRRISYEELHREVVRCAGALAKLGVTQGDRSRSTWAWSPRSWSRCSRAPARRHRTRVVFGGFAADALRDRINDCGAKVLITQDGGFRRGNVDSVEKTADNAVAQCPSIEKVARASPPRRTRASRPITHGSGRATSIGKKRSRRLGRPRTQTAVPVDAEHPLFILYTSGSTGKPKGVLHTTAGYLAGRARHHEVRLRPPPRRRLLVHRRRRLGHRAQLHRVRTALERRDLHDVRGRAQLPPTPGASGASSSAIG